MALFDLPDFVDFKLTDHDYGNYFKISLVDIRTGEILDCWKRQRWRFCDEWINKAKAIALFTNSLKHYGVI